MITFPNLESWNYLTKMATIVAIIDKKRVFCRISLRVLKDKFDASEEVPMHSVTQHRTAIQEAGRILIEREAFEADGSINIRVHNI